MMESFYKKLKNQLDQYFNEYVNHHTLNECVDYYYSLEDNSTEDALSFALPMIERYIDEFDHAIYDHIGCALFHCGSNCMLWKLIKAQMATENESAKIYYKFLIDSVTSGLQMTAAHGFQYDENYISELKNRMLE